MKTKNTQYLQQKIITLSAINLYQPVEKVSLVSHLDPINPKRLDRILRELKDEARISIDQGHYRITRMGMESLPLNKASIYRDIFRMNYLSNLSKKGGEF